MKGGIIVRLIDVVLIILFAFIAISDIQLKRQIRLPGKAEEKNQPEDTDTQYLFVNIDPNANFSVHLNEETLLETDNLNVLRPKLVQEAQKLRNSGQPYVIIIDPETDATVQSTINVYDICEEEGLPKSINMAIKDEAIATSANGGGS